MNAGRENVLAALDGAVLERAWVLLGINLELNILVSLLVFWSHDRIDVAHFDFCCALRHCASDREVPCINRSVELLPGALHVHHVRAILQQDHVRVLLKVTPTNCASSRFGLSFQFFLSFLCLFLFFGLHELSKLSVGVRLICPNSLLPFSFSGSVGLLLSFKELKSAPFSFFVLPFALFFLLGLPLLALSSRFRLSCLSLLFLLGVLISHHLTH